MMPVGGEKIAIAVQVEFNLIFIECLSRVYNSEQIGGVFGVSLVHNKGYPQIRLINRAEIDIHCL
jgi:hypothetical protein